MSLYKTCIFTFHNFFVDYLEEHAIFFYFGKTFVFILAIEKMDDD
jgi:hypothetical protein